MRFADADADFKTAKFGILGVPFDATVSYRSGSKFAPNAIRVASWSLESYVLQYDVELTNLPICDLGDLEEYGNVNLIIDAVEREVRKLIKKQIFPLLLGGEHSLTIGSVRALKVKGDVSVVILDAHLDFRDQYLELRNSHACVTKRVSELLTVKNIVVLGVRSMSKEERCCAEKEGLKYYTVDYLQEHGIARTLKNSRLKQNVYLSVDFDVFDPAVAPGVSNPEHGGLGVKEVKEVIDVLAPKLVGADIVEVCPPYDNGNTSVLAAKIVRDIIAAVWKCGHMHAEAKAKSMH